MSEPTTPSSSFDSPEATAAVRFTNSTVTVAGDLVAGNKFVGYSAEQVNLLLTQIQTEYRPKPFDGRSPYVGLDAFQERDADRFFGRETLIADLVARVINSAASNARAVFVAGPSGSGKSSLVRAGLIPALKKGNGAGSEHWLYETMKPGREPLAELERVLSRFWDSPNRAAEFRAQALDDATQLHAWVNIALGDETNRRAVIVIDQFEEIFTQLTPEQEKTRAAFLQQLTYAATIANGRTLVVFTLRSDFVTNCASYQALNALVNQQFLQVGAMSPDELVSAIARPALQVGLRLDPALIAQIVNDVRGEPGALPLMQFALKDLFDAQKEQGELTLDGYVARGGLHEALERHADAEFEKLDETEKQLARSVFGGLIEIGRGREDTKRTAIFQDLVPAGADEARVQQLVRELADARLITTDQQGDKETVTLAHERLITAWAWLQRLVNENREAIALQNEIAQDAGEWDKAGREEGYLYRGARLATAQEKLQDKQLVLSGLAQEFIETAGQAEARERQEKEAARQRELEQERQRVEALRQRARILRFAIAGVSLLAFVAILASCFAFVQWNIAIAAQKRAEELARQALINQSKILAAQSVSVQNQDPALAYLLGVEAFRPVDNPEARSRLFELFYHDLSPRIYLRGHTSSVSSVAFSPDGKLLASGSCREPDSQGLCQVGEISLWDMESNQRVAELEGNLGPISSLEFSPDGKLLACGDDEGNLSLWDMKTKESIGTWKGHLSTIYSVVFSPDSRILISGSFDGKLIVWNVVTRQSLAETKGEPIGAVALSPDGKTLALVGWDMKVRLWDISIPDDLSKVTLTQIAELDGHTGPVFAVAFSPNGKKLASGTSEILVWDVPTVIDPKVATKKPTARLTGYKGAVHSLAFSLDGKTLMSAGDQDTLIRLWDLETNQPVGEFQGHTGTVNAIKLSRDGKTLASGGTDKEIVLWNAGTGRISEQEQAPTFFETENPPLRWKVGSGQARGELLGNDLFGQTVAFSPDGNKLLTVSSGNSILWDVSDPRNWTGTRQTTSADWVIQNPNGIPSIAFSPDSKTFALANVTDPIQLWDIPTRQLSGELVHNGEYVQSVAFSNDGKMIAGGGCDRFDCQAADSKGIILLWNATTKQSAGELDGHTESVETVTFSPHGDLLAAGNPEGIMLWDVVSRQKIGTLKGHAPFVFDSTGKILASAGDDNAIWLWDVETRQLVGELKSHAAPISSLTFSPDGKTLASGSCRPVTTQLCTPGEILLWDMATQQRIGTLNGHADMVLSMAFSPDGKILASSSADNRILLWDVDVQSWVDNACKVVNRNMTRSEYVQYINRNASEYDAVYAQTPTCPGLPVEPLPTPTPTP